MAWRIFCLILFAFISSLSTTLPARAAPFDGGWRLDSPISTIGFLSVKKGTIAEYSGFESFSGEIDEGGHARITIALDSVNTGIDLRNVRMRFLFFETFEHPEARITATIPEAELAGLEFLHRKTIDLTVTLELHGTELPVTTPVTLSLLDENTVNVSTVQPIILSLADLELLEGLSKLEEAASVTITPVGIVTLDLTFRRNGSDATPSGSGLVIASGAATALETSGSFNREECVGRFEILSRSRSLTFASNTARISAEASSFLDLLSDVVARCPDLMIEVGGHTDSFGDAGWNLELSRQRASAVRAYLIDKGLPGARLKSVGYGEAEPLADNATPEGRAKNRRIAFSVLN